MATKQILNIAGLEVNVYSSASTGQEPAVVFFLLHGRHGSTEAIEPIAKSIIDQSHAGQKKQGRKLFVVTFDQRNHGKRLTYPKANEGWNLKNTEKHNDNHAVDMYAIQTGTATDVSFLIDFLPSHLFPNGERFIAEWGVAGISLGGHATWTALKRDSRIKTGIPIIGCPDYLTLITQRAQKARIPIEPPFIPESFRELVQRVDPGTSDYRSLGDTNPFLNKRILVLSGKIDTLVPWKASQSFVEGLEVGAGGVKCVSVHEGVGHECTEAMVQEMSEFITKWCL